MRLLRLALLAVLTLASASALAVEPDEVMKDPALEARARELSAELRCLVCQNQKNLAARTNFRAWLTSRRR